jgi:hypothetical protein
MMNSTFMCGNCSLVVYCGLTCQESHWATHKPCCKPLITEAVAGKEVFDGFLENMMEFGLLLIAAFVERTLQPVPGFLEEGTTLRLFLANALYVPESVVEDLATGRIGQDKPSSAAFRKAYALA